MLGFSVLDLEDLGVCTHQIDSELKPSTKVFVHVGNERTLGLLCNMLIGC